VETPRWLLAQEKAAGGAPYDSLNQIWAGGPGGLGETNGVLAGFSLDNIPVGDPQKGGGTISLKIIDCERKVNINTVSPMQLQQVLTVMGVDADSISVVVDSIENWVNPETAARPAGAESDYYQGLIPPYYAKNAPVDDLSELLLVKGVTHAMYYGGVEDDGGDHTQPVFHNKLGFGNAPGQENYPFGLKDVFTPISTGRININTADANVLQTLPGVDAQVAQDIIKQRNGLDGGDATPFVNVGQLQAAGISPQLVGQLNQLCDVRSHTFEVHVTAQIGNYQREYVALLLRNSPADIQVVGFYWVNKTANGG
jgi:type II secretory pathway component PulK